MDLTENLGSYLLEVNLKNVMKYSLLKGLGKGLLSAILFTVPIILANNPQWANITLGGILVMAVNYLKFKYKQA